jgi:hypothetical protein
VLRTGKRKLAVRHLDTELTETVAASVLKLKCGPLDWGWCSEGICLCVLHIAYQLLGYMLLTTFSYTTRHQMRNIGCGFVTQW